MTQLYPLRTAAITFLLFVLSLPAFSASGIFQTYAIVNSGSGNQFYAGGINSDGASLIFNGTNFGSFCPGSTLILNGGKSKRLRTVSPMYSGPTLITAFILLRVRRAPLFRFHFFSTATWEVAIRNVKPPGTM
jgi:hypothetical protein